MRRPANPIRCWKWPVILAALLLAPAAGHGGLFYKDYLLRTDRGRDILCAPYQVRPNDWVYKILKLRGEIANQDFPEFLEIFRRLNPAVDDINTIRPGQRILIPLRTVRREDLPLSPFGTVTIPFVQAVGKGAGSRREAYIVQPGDCVSKLLSERFGDFGSPAYRRAEARFQRQNPQVTNLDRIYAGQTLILGDPDESGGPMPGFETAARPAATPPSELSRLADLLDANLRNRGTYFLPRPEGSDIAIDLTRHPVLALADGTRLLVAGDSPPGEEVLAAARRYWPRLTVVATSSQAPLENQVELWMDALSDHRAVKPLTFVDAGIEVTVRARWALRLTQPSDRAERYLCVTLLAADGEKTPDTVRRYLEAHGIRLLEIVRPPPGAQGPPVAVGQVPVPAGATLPRVLRADQGRQFVADLLPAMGFVYADSVHTTFPHAGMRIEAVSNVVHPAGGAPLFIDFGDLGDDAASAIQAAGFSLVCIDPGLAPGDMVEKLLTALKAPFEKAPTVLAAARAAKYNTELKIPGVLRPPTTEGAGQLITPAEIDERLRRFLAQRRIGVISYCGQPALPAPGATQSR